ncbi:MAG: DEAD/DEAH box helicase [bacterium]
MAVHLEHGFQTLCFTVSRRTAELVATWARERMKEKQPDLAAQIATYRAGYLPEERRQIEERLRRGELRAVVSTVALEVGIDIGSLDSVIISGYPGTIISTWQQAGRSGRGTDESAAILVAFDGPLDQYIVKHPQKFFGTSPEHAIIDLENPYILMGHAMCAAAELPISDGDEEYLGALLPSALEGLAKEGLVRQTPRGWIYSGLARPVEVVNLNSISDRTVTVRCDGQLLETMDFIQANREAYPGAVILHQGETYVVEKLDLKDLTATARLKDVDYYTEAKEQTEIGIVKRTRTKSPRIGLSVGEVNVTEHHPSYQLKRYDRVIDRRPLHLRPVDFESVGMWFTVPTDAEGQVRRARLNFAGGLHAVEHGMIAMAPLYAMCDRWDLGGLSTPLHPDTAQPTIFLYDAFEGGIGIAEKCYELFDELVQATLELIRDCECKEGCPSCIYSPKCGNDNQPMDKKAALIILRRLKG